MVGEEDATWRRGRGGDDTAMEARGDAAGRGEPPYGERERERKKDRREEGRRPRRRESGE